MREEKTALDKEEKRTQRIDNPKQNEDLEKEWKWFQNTLINVLWKKEEKVREKRMEIFRMDYKNESDIES